MSITGRADGEPGGGPLRTGLSVSDITAGFYAVSAILAAKRWPKNASNSTAWSPNAPRSWRYWRPTCSRSARHRRLAPPPLRHLCRWMRLPGLPRPRCETGRLALHFFLHVPRGFLHFFTPALAILVDAMDCIACGGKDGKSDEQTWKTASNFASSSSKPFAPRFGKARTVARAFPPRPSSPSCAPASARSLPVNPANHEGRFFASRQRGFVWCCSLYRPGQPGPCDRFR